MRYPGLSKQVKYRSISFLLRWEQTLSSFLIPINVTCSRIRVFITLIFIPLLLHLCIFTTAFLLSISFWIAILSLNNEKSKQQRTV